MIENQAANKSESTNVDEINLIDFNEPEINNVEKEKIEGKITANKIAMYFLKLENSLQYIEIQNPYTSKVCNLLVDSGTQLNIIKRNQIPSNIILENRKINLSGITDKTVEMLGVIKMNIHGINIDFHVAPHNFCLPYDGILGIKILTEQKLRLDEGYLQVNNNKIKLKPAQKFNHNLNIITENAQKTDKKIQPRITIEQKEFLRKMLQNMDEQRILNP